MKKCIIFSRVSSTIQEYTEQTTRMRALAVQYGYPMESHILIEEKESAIKLTEEERLGLTKMKQYINSDKDIDCLFCFEVSRLARTKKVLFSVQEYLITHKIQLIIAQPTFIKLLNDDGTLSQSADFLFMIFSYFSENEMKIKKERFRNGKARLAKESKYLGGTLPYGYTTDAQNKIIIDEQTAETVRLIFNMYSRAEFSTNTLTDELSKIGVTDANGIPLNHSRVSRILTTPRYTGIDNYPQIVTPELYQECERLRHNAKVLRKKNYVSQYLCNKLITCNECGHHFTPGSTTYRCVYHHDYPDVCHNSMEINISMLDKIVWVCASDIEVSELMRKNKDKIIDYNKQLDILEQKKQAVYDKLSKYAGKVSRLQDMIIDGIITKEKAKEKMQKLDEQNTLFTEEVTALNNDTERVQSMINIIVNNLH
jgi:DNA invertase Pin-like site-specific DNA recombinase